MDKYLKPPFESPLLDFPEARNPPVCHTSALGPNRSLRSLKQCYTPCGRVDLRGFAQCVAVRRSIRQTRPARVWWLVARGGWEPLAAERIRRGKRAINVVRQDRAQAAGKSEHEMVHLGTGRFLCVKCRRSDTKRSRLNTLPCVLARCIAPTTLMSGSYLVTITDVDFVACRWSPGRTARHHGK